MEANKQTHIEGKNVNLRSMRKEDLNNRVKWFNDPEVNKSLILKEKLTLDKTIEWFKRSANEQSRKDFMIETLKGEPIGCIGFRQISTTNRSACFYIVIGNKDFWHRGIGSEASKILFEWGFEKLGLNKIWSVVKADNEKSIALLKKVGFIQEGLLREEEIINGKKIDVLRFGLLENDFSI